MGAGRGHHLCCGLVGSVQYSSFDHFPSPGFERFILLPSPSPNSSPFYPQHHPHGRIENLNKKTEKENYFLTQV